MAGTERSSGLGVAILGYGAIADMHAVALRAAGARLLVVAGPNQAEAKEFAGRHGVEAVVTDPAHAIETDGVEAVVIASPSPVHASQVADAIAAGRHVLVEIPLALSAADAEALVAQAAAARRTLMVCHTLRYWQPFHAARAAMDGRRAGGRATSWPAGCRVDARTWAGRAGVGAGRTTCCGITAATSSTWCWSSSASR